MEKPSCDIIKIENAYYVRAQSSLADSQTKVLMTGDLFAVFDRLGDFRTLSSTEQGLFYKEMRHLSRFVLRLKDQAPLLLSSSVRLDNAVFTADLTNPELRLADQRDLRRGTLHFSRSSYLWQNTCSQQIQVQNYDREMVVLELILELESDFADIFEVRGFKRESRGNLLNPRVEPRYPYAGVPWYSTIFGRDGITTALEFLWMCPEIAKGVLSCLSSTQALEISPERDSAPGKILHEMRQSEMAYAGEVPFGRYYGSVDSTPLFVLLAAEYYRRTGDLEFVNRISSNVERALHWIDRYGDCDGDGFIEYGHSSPHGLLQQGWKDSQDSVFHSDGRFAEGPIALCEVQGYVYAAKRGIADVFESLGKQERAAMLRREATVLKDRFHEAFWSDGISSYAIALDGEKQRCEVRSSNAGQVLFTGLGSGDHCRTVVSELESENFYSGWGVRTIAAGEARYNPMSYHNGSVWPHDNALIAWGLRGEKDKTLAEKILTGLFDASIFFDLHRMPELFCGFPKRTGEAPTLYPVACAPQAWAAGSVFLILQSCLGMQIDAPNAVIRFVHPMLPESVPYVRITGIRVGSAEIGLEMTRNKKTVSISILDRHGGIDIVTVK